jgi:hypothetical protein
MALKLMATKNSVDDRQTGHVSIHETGEWF